ncbi:MAG: MarR family winged helix-turn-helix transcriptional regulator [Sulfuricurvum sp.]|uniref:MarR family winged helix-turn-helix transcriptional regulator n=1 Tax=Sulfuricurvum sp. TaxID=2025608 RepID=UPI002625B943|nr:MarR family transcriptional regulator [Sulfuricurvum sp.]MDD2838457.1 MarR family transcriptional regulator [Sulfuricurvum sp.]MDD3598376.1 MarR family transcriptional regulator [Sulfuricurvum sp.]
MSFESDKSITFLIAKARNALKNEFERELKPYGISYAHRVILIRLCEQDALTQKELAQDTYFEQSNLTLMLDKMEHKGLVTRTQKENDRRAYLVKVTPKGRELTENLSSLGEAIIDNALRGIDEEHRQILAALLERIYANLKEPR